MMCGYFFDMRTGSTNNTWKKFPFHLLFLALCSFLLVSATVKYFTPLPSDHGVRDKFVYFAEHKDEYDLLLFGSSRVYRSFVPPVIEEELRKQGMEMRIFNFGYPAMGPFEADHMMRKALALKPARLKWIVMELQPWEPVIVKTQAFTQRAVQWHSLQQLHNALESVVRDQRPLGRRLSMAAEHLLHWAWKQTSYGCARDILDAWWSELEEPARLARWQGYCALEDDHNPAIRGRRKTFLMRQEGFEMSVKKFYLAQAQQEPTRAPLSLFNLGALERQQKAIRAAGAEPIYIIPPSKEELPQARELQRRGLIPVLMAYNRILKYPFFFKAENCFDHKHLNRETAERLSRIFAADLAHYLSRGGKK
jgi:hypothetical protein